jgi:lipopolysaccharide transport system ATP-binding protein
MAVINAELLTGYKKETMAAIEFKNVCVDFPIYNANSRSLKKRLMQVATGGQLGSDQQGRVVVRALEDLSFSLKDGDRIGLLGHNGAGKSTLLRLLCGVYEPSSGSAHIKGVIGSLIDISLGIDPESTGRENIYFRGGLLGMTRAEISKQIDDIIEFSELGNFVDMPVRTYSSGMHLRLAFSVSTILRPEILLMDEWLSVGDEGFKHKAELRMTELVQSTNILVIASHSRKAILQTCNRAIWLEHGKIRMDSDVDTVVTNYFAGNQLVDTQ